MTSPQPPAHLQNGLLLELNAMIHVKCLVQRLVHSEARINVNNMLV